MRDIGQCSNIVTRSNYGKEKQTCETEGPSYELQDLGKGEARDLITKNNKEVGIVQHNGYWFNCAINAKEIRMWPMKRNMH
jgi:hypothetical protein